MIRFWAECWVAKDWAAMQPILKSKPATTCKGVDYKPCKDSDKTECVGTDLTEYVYKLNGPTRPAKPSKFLIVL